MMTFLMISIIAMSKEFRLVSPDEKLIINVHLTENLSISAFYNGSEVVNVSKMAIELEGAIIGGQPSLRKINRTSIRKQISVPIPAKFSIIEDTYNALELVMKNGYSVKVRAYNNGFAYRFSTSLEDSIIVNNEIADMEFPQGTNIYFPEEISMLSHNERLYELMEINEIMKDKFCSLPFVAQMKGINVLFSEADLFDYPGMYVQKSGTNKFSALFPKYVNKAIPTETSGDRYEVLVEEAGYIARTNGDRSFPWRLFIIGEDKDLIESTLIYQLSTPSKLSNTKWIKPGMVAWDWYNDNNVFGVNFESGLNSETYKYYIDFASENEIEYIILDEGWSKSTTEITASSDILDAEELIQYGKEKGVGVILWVLWKPLSKDITGILSKYAYWGAAGVKIDFMQRSDQWMVNFYKMVAEEAASNKLLVSFHGAYKPTGLHRTYPNVLTFEGVKGNENNKWSKDITPDFNLTIPFIRMSAGPMDYTPGALTNTQLINHHISFSRPEGLGTRSHEVAKYVVYESPLQMLCDAPSRYIKEQETTNFITQIPVVWDETKVIEASIAEYLVIARRRGEDWYLAAMTDWDERTFKIPLDFLSDGEFLVQIMQDGKNANRFAEDYKLVNLTCKKEDTIEAALAKGGGFVAIFNKQ